MKRLYVIFSCAIVLLVASCSKNGNFPSIPALTFKSIYPTEVHAGDSVQITCGFRDKEGDIQDSIFFRASNTNVFAPYAIPDFPQQSNLQGSIILELERNLDFTAPSGAGATDTLYFDVYIKDRQGHISDTVQTTPVVVYGS